MKALIAVKSIERRDALYALLESLKRFEVIEQVDSEQGVGERLEASCPVLVLVDFHCFGLDLARWNTAIIVLAVDQAERAQAYAKGATQVFIEGTPVSQLVASIERRLEAGNEG